MNGYIGKSTIPLSMIVVLLVLSSVFTGCSSAQMDIQSLCQPLNEVANDSVNWHYAIYLDINACLTCCEDLKSWQMLEQKIPECGGMFSIWAPIEDSVDVAEVMRLEGIKSVIHILDSAIIESLQLKNTTPPIKMLISKDCNLEIVQGPLKAKEARKFDKKILGIICEGE
ncbi:MAG: hypothetical protein KAR42_13585 [candidate division Zixibacteria bacterium]|nr:hypothetical protein [candidate division Zixibacteria bacterium]